MDIIPGRGLYVQYSLTVDRVLAGTAPHQYYAPVTPGDGTFVTIACIKDVPNVGNLTAEMSEHRCLDDQEPFVEKVPTGFLTSEDTTIKFAMEKSGYSTLQGLLINNTPVCIRLIYAKTATETIASRHVRNGYIASISDAVPGDGKEVDAMITIAWKTPPLFTAGS